MMDLPTSLAVATRGSGASITERIQQTTEALGAISLLTERKFLAIGDRVERAVAILARLAATFEALLQEMRSDAVVQARQAIALAADEAGRLADAPYSEAAMLERLARYDGGDQYPNQRNAPDRP